MNYTDTLTFTVKSNDTDDTEDTDDTDDNVVSGEVKIKVERVVTEDDEVEFVITPIKLNRVCRKFTYGYPTETDILKPFSEYSVDTESTEVRVTEYDFAEDDGTETDDNS